MLEGFEQFCKDHEKTIAFVEAFSTLSAVIVSLLLGFVAGRASRTRLKAWVGIKFILHHTIDPAHRPTYLIATITNTGIMPLRLPFGFFHWQLPRQKNASWMVNPIDCYGGDEWVPQQKYPVEIPPRATHEAFVNDIATFREGFNEMLRQRNTFIGRILLRFVRVTIITDDGTRFRAKISKNVYEEISRLRRQRQPQRACDFP